MQMHITDGSSKAYQGRSNSLVPLFTTQSAGFGGRYVSSDAIKGIYGEDGVSLTYRNAEKSVEERFFGNSEFYSNKHEGMKRLR